MDSRHLTLGRAPRDPSNSHLGGASVPPRGTVAFLFSNILASLASSQLDLTLGQGGVGGVWGMDSRHLPWVEWGGLEFNAQTQKNAQAHAQ